MRAASTRLFQLGHDARGASGPGVLGLTADPIHERRAQRRRREHEVVEPCGPRVAGEQVEQLGEVFAE